MSETFQQVAERLTNIRAELDGAIAILTMNRPKALNALNDQTLEELDRIFTCLEREESILGVIITGEGKGFVAGADISQMQSYKSEEGRNYANRACLTKSRPWRSLSSPQSTDTLSAAVASCP